MDQISVPTGWEFCLPANNLKEAAKMLMEALASASHLTMLAVLSNAVSLPAYDGGHAAFEEGLPGQP